MAWRVLGASQAGSSHITRARQCEDAFDSRVLADGTLVVAVADGAGSASHGYSGAIYATTWALELVDLALEGLDKVDSNEAYHDALSETVEGVRHRFEFLSAETGLALRDLACTLIVLVVTKRVAAVAQIGDGAVVCRAASGDIFALSLPVRSEYLNETSFLTSDDFRNRLTISLSHLSPASIAVMTDGLQSLAFDLRTEEPFVRFFEPLFAFASNPLSSTDDLIQFLSSEQIAQRTDDDTTLVLGSFI